jgi:anti-anti-sigma factor
VVSVFGEVDMLTAPQLFPEIERCVAAGCLVVDLAGVSLLESSGLKALLDIRGFSEERGCRAGSSRTKYVMRPLEITGLEVLAICRSVDEALREPGPAAAVD